MKVINKLLYYEFILLSQISITDRHLYLGKKKAKPFRQYG